jgi:hypothetical protein
MSQTVLPFKIEWVERPETCTAHAGLLVFLELCIALIPNRALRPLRDALGYQSTDTVRRHLLSLLALIAAGGEHIDDTNSAALTRCRSQ